MYCVSYNVATLVPKKSAVSHESHECHELRGGASCPVSLVCYPRANSLACNAKRSTSKKYTTDTLKTPSCPSRGERTWASKLSATAPVFVQSGGHTASGTLLARPGEESAE